MRHWINTRIPPIVSGHNPKKRSFIITPGCNSTVSVVSVCNFCRSVAWLKSPVICRPSFARRKQDALEITNWVRCTPAGFSHEPLPLVDPSFLPRGFGFHQRSGASENGRGLPQSKTPGRGSWPRGAISDRTVWYLSESGTRNTIAIQVARRTKKMENQLTDGY